MTALFAAVSGALFVGAAWESFGALLRLPLLDLLAKLLAPARDAGRDGHAPADDDARRLQAVAIVTLGATGLLAAGAAAGIVFAASAPLAATALLRIRARRWRDVAAQSVVPVARALADAIAAGYPLPRAIDSAARDGAVTGPGRTLLAEAAARLALGEAADQALQRMTRRAGTSGWEALSAAILIQRETGGDLSRLLRDLATGLERGAQVDADARAASAQARLTARIVLALPVLACALTEIAAPGATAALLSDPLARLMVVAAAVLQVAALVAVRRIAKFEE